MTDGGRYRGKDPHSLSRALKYRGAPCPVCGTPVRLVSDATGGVVSLGAPCPACGKTHVLSPSVLEDGDVRIEFDGREYEPSAEAASILKRLPGLSGAELLAAERDLSAAYGSTLRPAAARKLGEKVLRDAEGVEGAEDVRLSQASALAALMRVAGDMDAAEELEDGLVSLAEGRPTAEAFRFRLNRAMDQLADGDAKGASATANRAVADLDRLKCQSTLPAEDPSLRARAYEQKGIVAAARRDMSGAAKAFKTALADSEARFGSSGSPEDARDAIRAAGEYAFACRDANMKKRSLGALKDAVRLASRVKDVRPDVYAEALLTRARYLSESDEPLAGVRADMDECISLLGSPDADGDYDPLLPLAYLYRSMTGPDKDGIDEDDLGRSFRILVDGTVSGSVPDTLLTTVGTVYLAHLEAAKSPDAERVRAEMARMGIMSRRGRVRMSDIGHFDVRFISDEGHPLPERGHGQTHEDHHRRAVRRVRLRH